jgi:hypothetical protein
MHIYISAPKNINDLSVLVKKTQAGRDLHKLRSQVSICVIDDEPFHALNNLRNNQFSIIELGDVRAVATVSNYPIILCDLRGVGGELNSVDESSHLIKEIKKQYPDKYVIAYTGEANSTTIAKRAKESADLFLKKDASLDQWIEILDQAILLVSDPVEVWKGFRNRLLEAGVPLIDLVGLEHGYVKGIESQGLEPTKRHLNSIINRLDLSGDVRVVAQNFISSIIFKLVFNES